MIVLLVMLPAVLVDAAEDQRAHHALANPALRGQVVLAYAAARLVEYQSIVQAAEHLQQVVEDFLRQPDPVSLAAARQAWVEARIRYAPSECHRFAGGPIDEPKADLENQINAWPIDESYIDAVDGQPLSGIINQPGAYPELSLHLLRELNRQGGEKNVAIGYHAIEFLLWGQGRQARGPGVRSCQDYQEQVGGPSVQRRRAYLRLVIAALIADLRQVCAAWQPDMPGGYADAFVHGPPDIALQAIFTGLSTLSGDEMACERLAVAYETKSMEDGQSCFSCTSLTDLIGNQEGIRATYLGAGPKVAPGLSDLVRAVDPLLDQRLRAQLDLTLQRLRAIPGPFGQAIQGDDASPGRRAVLAAITTLEPQRQLLVLAARSLGITVGPGIDTDHATHASRPAGQPDD